MNWKETLEKRIKAHRQILFSKDDDEIAFLIHLTNEMPKKAVVLWALELAEDAAKQLETKYPFEKRPKTALTLARMWAAGEIKMPAVKKAILDCHAAAKEIASGADAARCHAVGQACGTVHTTGHAAGFPVYDLTALIRENSPENWDEIIQNRMNYYIERLLYWKENFMNSPNKWADFLTE